MQTTIWLPWEVSTSLWHNYKPFPKRVSPHRVGNYWFMSDEWRRKGCTFGFHFWALGALYSQWTWVGLIHRYVSASHRKSAMLTFAKEVPLLSRFQKIFSFVDLFLGKILHLINYVYWKRIHLHEMQIMLASLENMDAIKTVLPPLQMTAPFF